VTAHAGEARLGLTICYDMRFPALYRALAQAGAEVLTVPAAFTRPTGQAHWEVLLRARAIETGSFILAPAQGGFHEDGRGTWGRSLAVGPWGEVLGVLDHDEPGVLVVDLDLPASARARRSIPALANARAEILRLCQGNASRIARRDLWLIDLFLRHQDRPSRAGTGWRAALTTRSILAGMQSAKDTADQSKRG
jgi:predicted amidohydrolase